MENAKVIQTEFFGDIVRHYLNRFTKNTSTNYKVYILEFFRYYNPSIKKTSDINMAMLEAVNLGQVENYILDSIEKYRNGELGDGAVRFRRNALSSLFKYIMNRYEHKYVKVNHFANPIIKDLLKLNLPVDDDEPDGEILEIDEIREMIEIANKKSIKRDYLLLRLLCRGLRREEVSGVKFNSFYQKGNEWYLRLFAKDTKGKKSRTIFIPDELVNKLKEEYWEAEFGKTNRHVFGIKGHRVNEIVVKYTTKFNKDITAHRLRHSMATYLAEHATLEELMDFMGWKDPQTAMRYIRHVTRHKKNVGRLIPEGI